MGSYNTVGTANKYCVLRGDNMKRKTRQRVCLVIAIILVAAMVLPLIVSVGM